MNSKSTFSNLILSNEPTVIEEFKKVSHNNFNSLSEKELEQKFINQLEMQGYEYLKLPNNTNHEDFLIKNLRLQLENLNKTKFSDTEWDLLFNDFIAKSNEGITEKTNKFQTNYIYELKRDSGEIFNVYLIKKDDNLHENKLQVINQYVSKCENHNRYDVTILINGLPIVSVELKRPMIKLEESFKQLLRYRDDSFGASHGLFNYVQIFVMSNINKTKYFANTKRFIEQNGRTLESQAKNSYEFTMYWADSKNQKIDNLFDFAETFFSKHTILNILSKYCIFTSANELLVMRPYQIVATERIINKILYSHNDKKVLGTVQAGGYVWHATGSGKTITSFKAAQIASKLDYVDKVIFVVDRKDLDYQTMKEYDKFEKGCANSNTSTKILQKQLESNDPQKKIIITTIQKLSFFIKNNKNSDVYNKHIVLIFDECHRSQFGEMNTSIKKNFKKHNIFGFTGTPIFSENSKVISTKTIANDIHKTYLSGYTTEQQFGERLHTYNIVDAINDNNVLPFNLTTVQTIKNMKDNVEDEEISEIDKKEIFLALERIANNVEFIIKNFDSITYRKNLFDHKFITNTIQLAKDKHNKLKANYEVKNIKGFNSILATSSIEHAKLYYQEFKRQQENKIYPDLKIATIFSFSQNDNISDTDDYYIVDENNESVESLDQSSKEFLKQAIDDYNQMFNTNWDISSEGFQGYYRDLSLKMKNKEVDLLIVVNMFLTGFDAPTLNTLWVDKKLKLHGLIQAFSRTNRIFNSGKKSGNIVSFLPIKQELDDAIRVYSGDHSSKIVTLREYNDYYNGYTDENGVYQPGYYQVVENLRHNFPIGKELHSDAHKKEFINEFGLILQKLNLLKSFINDYDDSQQILSEDELTNYLGKYHTYYNDLKTEVDIKKTSVVEDIVFETTLIQQIDINLEYIFQLISEYIHTDEKIDNLARISKILDSSYEFRNKKDLIIAFINSLNNESDNSIYDSFNNFINEQRNIELDEIIKKHNLKPVETHNFVNSCFQQKFLKTNGTEIDDILPAMSRFTPIKSENRIEKKQQVINDLQAYFDKFLDLN